MNKLQKEQLDNLNKFKAEAEILDGKIKDSIKSIQTSTAQLTDDDLKKIYGSIGSSLDYLHQRISNLSNAQYQHQSDGHLPKIPSKSHMDKALKTLGLDSEYETAPKTMVYASQAEFIVEDE